MTQQTDTGLNRLFLRSVILGLALGGLGAVVAMRRMGQLDTFPGAETALQTRSRSTSGENDPVAQSLANGKAAARRRRNELGLNEYTGG